MDQPAVSRTRGPLLLGLLITFCALGVIGVVTYLGWNIGPVALGVGITGALLPVPVLVACFLWLDRYQPSPLWIMAACFLWGAGIATSGALVVNNTASNVLGWSDTIVASIVAPVIEETLKAALPLLLFVFRRRYFAGIIDGIVYCGLSATGFAMVENVLYVGGHAYASGAETGVASGAFLAALTFILRVPMTGFLHPLFTAMTGIGLGIAARSPRRATRVVAPLLGLLVAMLLHGAWNFMATLAVRDPYYLLYGYFAVFMPIFFGMVGYVLWVRSWEGRLAERVLPVYTAAGWFSPPEVAALATLGRRLSARRWAKRFAGDVGAAAMRRYQAAATSLALLRDGLDRGLYVAERDLAGAVAEERRLLDEIESCRRAFAGPWTPPVTWTGGAYEVAFPDGVTRSIVPPPLPVVPVPYHLPQGYPAQR